MMTLFFPTHAQVMFSYVSLANMDNVVLAALFDVMVDSSKLEAKPFNFRFERQGFESYRLFHNSGDVLLVLAISIIAVPLIILMDIIFSRYRQCVIWEKARRSLKFSLFIRFFLEGYLELFFSSVLNCYNYSFDTIEEVSSFVISAGLVVVFILFTFLAFYLITTNQYASNKENEKFE